MDISRNRFQGDMRCLELFRPGAILVRMELRRLGLLDTWHFRPDCKRWPRDDEPFDSLDFDEWTTADGPPCNECRAKRENDRLSKHDEAAG